MPALDPTHAAHPRCREALIAHRPALAGHAAFEAFSVLTRLPVPLRLTGAQAATVLTGAFPEGCWLDADATDDLYLQLADHEIVGGSVYDALVGAAARHHDRVLLTRDRRAERVYRSLGIAYRFVA